MKRRVMNVLVNILLGVAVLVSMAIGLVMLYAELWIGITLLWQLFD